MRRRVKAAIFFLAITATVFVANNLIVNNHNPLLEKDNLNIDSNYVSAQKLFDSSWQLVKSEYYDSTLNKQNWSHWKNHYHNKIKTDDDAKVAIDTMLASLNDPYSRFLDKREFLEQNTSILSKYSGIGVSIVNDSGKIKINNVIQDTPAQFADLQVGDIILAIDDIKVSGLSLAEVSNLVKGQENTFLDMDILRNKDVLKKKIIRKEIQIKTVKSSFDKDIGYIQILSFISNSTPNELLEALENTSEAKGLIIDLRGNTGGLLPNAIFAANLFIQKGKIVSIVGRNGYHYDIMAKANTSNLPKIPIVILVDENSASASEIFLGAMKDYHRATLVGTKSFGKGLVQKIIPLSNETGINLTIAKYLTPHGKDINKKGISPDIFVKANDKKDTQLEKAKSILKNKISLKNI